MTDATDTRLIDFLSRPETYGLKPGTPVEHIETHISHVFLAGDRAFKMKKPVSFTFLDFSTVDKRRAACDAELALNRRTAPDIYRAVIPVCKTQDRLTLGGEDGEPVEWLVEMTRFGADGLLATKAAQGTLELPLVEALAADVARFHAAAEIHTDAGGAGSFLAIVEDNLADMRADAGAVFDEDELRAVTEASRAAIENHRALLDRRPDAGCVRHCHGDLHLGNVTEIDGRPVIFDCIEFSARIARIDVLYDLAFLLMDLAFRAESDARLAGYANRALNVYLDHVKEADIEAASEGLALLPLFMATRAVIRAKVTAVQAKGEGAEEKRNRARAYLAVAARMLRPATPRLVAVGGLSGSGKSTLAKKLSGYIGGPLGAVHIRSDTVRKRLFGVAPLERLPDAAYTQEAGRRVYDEMMRLARLSLAAGMSVVVDAVFAQAGERDSVAALARDAGTRFDGFWLDAPAGILETRVAAREKQGGDPSDAGVAALKRQFGYDLGAMTWRKVDAAGTPDEALAQARGFL